ncbi:hypothetical protein LTR37_011144 [Vermiconidia calcicola]|uniref:Uncharacterized protein n=1 Tax=Vermiconidia calcicola TaxID=1690605 RepID=A0ACC3N4J1_9PEZI|nr:hypothetical protein LTR37_011144 [Vermiconidia calcicola]
MSLFPRFVTSEFAPMFRLLDEYASHAATRSSGFSQAIRSFQPRFDVKESKDSYELQGELPGIDQKDINIEFTDANTLSIHGRSERHREEGTRPAAVVEAPAEQPKIAESETSSYHKASVENEDGTTTTTSGANPEATPASTPGEGSITATESQQVAEAPKTARPKYWVSERSVGQFARTFSFPRRVDQENVKASLKNGILSLTIPKAAPPVNKRINID